MLTRSGSQDKVMLNEIFNRLEENMKTDNKR